jgi:uncharacterized protein
MRNSVTAKTKWAPKRHEVAALLLALIVLLGIFTIFRSPETRTLRVGAHHYELEVMVSEKDHAQGLSGRQSLAQNRGMLFMFQREGQHCFWMKDMRFSLDIIWADAHHKVVHLEREVSPDSYPRTFCTGTPAAYVIELPAGTAKTTGIHKGQVLNF